MDANDGAWASQNRILQRVGGVWFDFEQLVRQIYEETVKPGDWVFDVGANRGDHTFQLATCVAPSGQVIGVEAVPELAAKLNRDLATHYKHLADFTEILNFGAYDRDGTANFYSVPSQTGLGSLMDRPNVGEQKVLIEVQLRRLDDLIKPIRAPLSFMKFDIEGAELFALRGAEQHIEIHKPVIVFEFDKVSAASFSYTADDMLRFFELHSYRIYDFFGNQMLTREDFESSLVWNYVAFSGREASRRRIFDRLDAFVSGLQAPSQPD